MAWRRWPFLNHSARDCLFALKSLRQVYGDKTAWPLIEKKVSDLISRDRNTVRGAIINDGMSPRAIVLNAVTNVCFDEATSGFHHIYRGRLSMMGLSYKSVFYRNVEMQFANDLLSEDQKRELIRDFETEVKGAG